MMHLMHNRRFLLAAIVVTAMGFTSCAGAQTSNEAVWHQFTAWLVRGGILIFVSMAEHYARVIADEGIAQKAHQTEWQAAIDTLIEHIRNDRVAAGFVAAVERCGAVLAEYAPPDGSANELPDRLYVI